jgi:hypothetical protein
MPQWRKLHTKITQSLDVNDMPDDFTRLLWTWLPLIADREGRGIDNPSWIRSRAMPLRSDLDNERIADAMQYFVNHEMVLRYSCAGRDYFCILNFHDYQGKTDREAPSFLPAPTREQLKSNSRPTHERRKERLSTDSDSDSDGAKAPKAGKPETEFQKSQQEYIDLFCNLTGIPQPDHKSKSFRTPWGGSSATVVKALNGHALECLPIAVNRLRKQGMTIATPKSVEKTIIAIYGEKKTPTDEHLTYVA